MRVECTTAKISAGFKKSPPCRACGGEVWLGQPLAKVTPGGWVHKKCARSYVAAIEDAIAVMDARA